MKKRLDWLDYGKGITILMVVIYHGFTYLIPKVSGFEMTLMDFISGFLFLFIMPLFFAFSGYLHNKVNDSIQYKTQIIKKVKGFLLPYILFSVLYVSLENLSGSNNVTNFRSFKSLIYIFTDPVAHTWFLMSLFLMTIIFGLFDLMKIKLRNQIIISAILTVIGVFVSPYIFDSLGRTLSYLLFFAFGEYIRYIDDKNNIKISNKNLALFIGALFFI
ncbi:MAG: acyltransferase family protein, partial [Staphylococcus epidermidis]|nr:acyltransferase family protein [Staphylococcus epidermidis]